MKKKFAVLNMIARHTLPLVLVILVGLMIANAVVFRTELEADYLSLGSELDGDGMYAVFFIAYLLLTVVLGRAMCDRGGRQNYFLYRLRDGHMAVYLTQALYNALCYALLFGVETLSLLGLGAWCRADYPERFNQQTLILTCYQSSLLHTVFPMHDILLWVTDLAVILGLGACTAAVSARNRSRSHSIVVFLMVMVLPLMLLIHREEGSAMNISSRIISIIASVFFLGISVCGASELEVDANG